MPRRLLPLLKDALAAFAFAAVMGLLAWVMGQA